MLSVSGIRVFVLCLGIWDEGGVDGKKKRSVLGEGGVCGRGGVCRGIGVVVCVVYWRRLKGAVVRLISYNAPLKASMLLGIHALDGNLFHSAIVRGKKLYL